MPIKFDVLNRFTGSIVFTAEIECSDDAPTSFKLGLAVKLALKARANLSGANLSVADLSGANLSRADLSRADLSRANLSGAYLSGAYLSGAYLSGANLSGANLSGANLSRADLSRANLSRANLSRANLSGAYLSGAIGAAPELSTPLLMLLDQPGKIRAYKLVNERGEGPMRGGVIYEIGKSASAEANTDATEHCGSGINVATLDWCLREWQPGYRILIVEFEAADIACVPTATDGKFRLHRCQVIAEKAIDPVALGLVKAAEPIAA